MFNYKVCNISESYFCNFQESWFRHWLIHLLTMESINVALINFKIFSCRMNNHKSHCFQYLFHTKVSSNSDVYIIWRVCQHIFFYFCGYFLYKPAACWSSGHSRDLDGCCRFRKHRQSSIGLSIAIQTPRS